MVESDSTAHAGSNGEADMTMTDATTPATVPPDGRLAPGTKVEVRRSLDGKWAQGFEVIAGGEAGYRLRRLSDGVELPVEMPAADVRRARKRDMWWI